MRLSHDRVLNSTPPATVSTVKHTAVGVVDRKPQVTPNTVIANDALRRDVQHARHRCCSAAGSCGRQSQHSFAPDLRPQHVTQPACSNEFIGLTAANVR